MDKNLISTAEVAKVLGVSRQAVLKKIVSGEIKARKIGKNYAVNRKDLSIEAGGELTASKKELIDRVVRKTVREYGQTLRLLGKE